MKIYKRLFEDTKIQIEKLMKDWWWNSNSRSRDQAIKLLKQNPSIREESIQNLEKLIKKPIKNLKVYQHEDYEGLSISYTLSKSVAERFADESDGRVQEYTIDRKDIFYYTGNSEKEIFLNWDI